MLSLIYDMVILNVPLAYNYNHNHNNVARMMFHIDINAKWLTTFGNKL